MSRPERQPIEDVRGRVAGELGSSSNRLSVPNRTALAEEYAEEVSVDELSRRSEPPWKCRRVLN